MTGKQIRAAVVGATSLLGKELIEELSGSAAASWDLRLLDEGEDGEAQLTSAGEEAVVVQPLTREALEGMDLVFFAGEPSAVRTFWRGASDAGASIVDLTGTLEGEPGFSVRSPWIAGGSKPDLATKGVIAAHAAALMLALVVDRISRRFGPVTVAATVLEPASQAGRAGVDELHQQTVSLLSFQSVPREVFDAQVAFNLQEQLGDSARVQPRDARVTVRRHLKALLGDEAQAAIRLNVVQAPVFHGYTVSALVEVGTAIRDEDLRSVLNGGAVQAEAETEPSNLAAAESADLLIQVRPDVGTAEAKAFWLWMAADNLRLAARNAVAAAMELASLRPGSRVQ